MRIVEELISFYRHIYLNLPGFPTAFLEKGEPFRESSPQQSISTKGFVPCASQPVGPSSLRTALDWWASLVPVPLYASEFFLQISIK